MEHRLLIDDDGNCFEVTDPTPVPNDLTELYELLRSLALPMTHSLPLFGGGEPTFGTSEVWSWNRTHVLVGSCPGDLEIMSREEWDDWSETLVSS